MKTAALLILTAASLCACSKPPKVDAKNATPEQVAKQVRDSGADAAVVRPGLWQSKVTIEKFDIPGMPAEMAGRMKAMMAENQEHGFQTCLTAEDVKKPKEDFFAGKNNQCRYDRFTMGDGKIDAVMRCGKGQMMMKMAGTYAPDSYQMQTAMSTAGDKAGQSAMNMQMRIEAKRVGECKAKQG